MATRKSHKKKPFRKVPESQAIEKVVIKEKIQKSPKSHKKLHILLGLIVAILGFVLYVNTIGHGYAYDDHSVIGGNWLVKKGIDGVPQILETSYRYGYWSSEGALYRPLSLVMFAIEWEYFPGNPSIGHLINILLYALLGFLLFYTLKDLFRGYNYIVPFIASLLFIAHPVHTEVVANIKSRDEILCMLFTVSSLYFFIKYLQNNKLWLIALALITYFIAFTSKESALTQLIIYPLIMFLFYDVKWTKNIIISALFLVVAVLFVYIRSQVLGDVLGVNDIPVIDNFLVGAKDPLTKLATSIYLMGKYLLLLIFLHPLSCDYSFNQISLTTFGDPLVIITLLIYAGMIYFAVRYLKTHKIIAFGIIYFLATISIYSNLFVTIGSSFAERFLFMPSLGFCIVIAMLLGTIFKIDLIKQPIKFVGGNKGLIFIMAVVIISYSFKTVIRNRAWESNLILYETDVKTCPNSARLHNFYGMVIMKVRAMKTEDPKKRSQFLDSAIAEFQTAIEIYPSYADAYDQLGLAYYRKKDFSSAKRYYEAALDRNPALPKTLSNLGGIYFEEKEYNKALEVYKLAVKYNPRFADAYFNLGSTYGVLKQNMESIEAFKKGLIYNPNHPTMNYYLGIVYKRTGDTINANKYFNISEKLKAAQNRK